MQILPTDALLIIDMQVDFMPGGALAVAGADTLIPPINALAARFPHVLLTQDWHPPQHISFASTHALQPFTDTHAAPYGPQALWPDHCLLGSPGAALVVDIPHAELILRKGFRQHIDSYSAFLENDRTTPTGLAGYLRERALTRLFFCGVAYDFCVRFSALNAVDLGFPSIVLEDLTRPVALPASPGRPASVEATNQAFAQAGVHRLQSSTL